MDTWKCDECNIKFDSRLLFETHKRKFCGLLDKPLGPASSRSSQRGYDYNYKCKMDDVPPDKREKSKKLASPMPIHAERNTLKSKSYPRLSPGLPSSDRQRMSMLEQEKVEELKAFKASMSVMHRDYQPSKIKSGLGRKVLDMQSNLSTNYQGTTLVDDQMKQLQENYQEQLDQLRVHNERLKEEKLVINEKMNSLGLRSRQKQVSPGSIDKQVAESEGLKKYLDYKSKEIRSSPNPEHKDTLKHYTTGSQNRPLIVPKTGSVSLPQYAVPHGGGLLGEISAMKMSYLQGGGKDRDILTQIKQLELEAKGLPHASLPASDPALQQKILAYHLANQRLEQELQLLRMEGQQNDVLRKTPELTPEFQRLKSEHLEKMAELRQESEMLEQLAVIERMKKDLNDLKADKTAVTKEKYETPFLISASGIDNSLLPSPYDPSAGFFIFWDFILGMPVSSTKCRLAVGIYNGTELATDVKVLPLVNVVNQEHSKIPPGRVAVFGIMHPFPNCAPIQTLCLIAELQTSNTDDAEDPHRLFSKGWTKIDLFDTADRLISGRWKIPFRVPPIKTYLSYNELNRVPQVGMTELYIRLVNARDVKQEEMLNPQPTQFYIYRFPSMDTQVLRRYRTASVPSTAASEPSLSSSTEVVPPTQIQGNMSLASLESNHSDGSSILGFQVDQLYNAIDGEVKIKITAYNQQDGEILKAAGDTPVMCVTKSCKQDFLKDIYVFGLQEALFRQVQWNSKSIIVVRLYLQPKEPDTDQIAAVNLLDDKRLVAWTLIPLTLRNGRKSRQSQGRGSSSSLNVGTHTVQLFFPPVPDVADMPIKNDNYRDEWVRYGFAAFRMTIFSGLQRPLERPSTPSEYTEENEIPRDVWIENGRPSVTSQPFKPGSGFDLYIDGARFLPDSVTFSKVAGRVMDKNYDKVGSDFEAQSKLYSDIYNPEFDHRVEFREPVFPATSTVMLKVYTVDRVSKMFCCLGYAVLPLFLKLESTELPSNNSDTEKVSLNEGSHQIRIFNGVPDFSQPLGQYLVQTLRPVPCASLLVRIALAPCHPNGRPKESSEFPAKRWKKEGLLVTKQSYEEGQYFSHSCEPTLGECQIFHSMVLRQKLTVRESIKLIATSKDIHTKKDQVIASWINAQLTRSIDADPEDFNLNYVALYQELHGLKVSIDGARNIPWSNFTFATCCLSPPGSFYKGDPADSLTFVSQLVYSSDVSSPVWIDEMKSFPRRLHHRFLVLVVHVHEVTIDSSQHQEAYGLKGQGWTAIQVFNEGYVMNGSYQLPLYQGEPSESLLDALRDDYCQDVLAAFRRNKKIKFLEGASVFIRLSDARREEELPKAMEQVIQDHLPKEKLDRYAPFSPSKPISSLIPLGVDEYEFSHGLPKKFKEMMNQIFNKNVQD